MGGAAQRTAVGAGSLAGPRGRVQSEDAARGTHLPADAAQTPLVRL